MRIRGGLSKVYSILLIGFLGLSSVGNIYGEEVKTIKDYNQVIELKDFEGKVILCLDSDIAFIDGKEVQGVSLLLEDNRVLLPLRITAEGLKAKVDWDKKTGQIDVTTSKAKITLKIGSKTMQIGNKNVSLEVAPFIKNKTTYLPLRAIGEALGVEVKYDQANKFVYVGGVVDGYLNSTLQIAFEKQNYNIIFSHKWCLIGEKNNKLFYRDLDNDKGWIELIAKQTKDKTVKYASFHVGDGIMGTDLIVRIVDNKQADLIVNDDIYDFQVQDGYVYYIKAHPMEALLSNTPEMMQYYDGNLMKVSIEEAIKANPEGRQVEGEILGEKGYFYGIGISLGSWEQDGKLYPMGFELNEGGTGYLVDWEVKPGGIYAIGVDVTSEHGDQTQGKYKVALTGNTHEKLQ